ncbi:MULTISPECIES: hypothetical protein [unclassified Streptomyces]|uniref:hypothetical protein n=1 Tax=unclassified Streptomyces TaxID=2593676 RepID=UPI001BE98765|nr:MULTISPECIES: hypothetical protein [unclassified Streptomyces]MBT2403506.1 hypothetical protein [Streptomyces sp. ISL-21]MBT2459731.1 hypothetical protein [Streptomyces sp. ISL-86]MBT2612604.1 hypothetical protein [Streptomyces sp. ISL-87]
MSTAEEDRRSRRLAWCVALLLRHAPDHVAADLLGRLDPATRRFLCRDEFLPAAVVTLLLRDGTDQDRRTVARNPHVLGRPLPGLPGPARYAARPGPSPELLGTLRAELGREPEPPLTSTELIALLRRHGRHRPRVPLDVLALPHELDPGVLLREHARAPLPPGSVEALLLVGGLDRQVCRALLDTRAQRSYGPHWHRPAVRAVRSGTLTFDDLVAAVAPAHRTLLLGQAHAIGRFAWNLAEWAAMRSALARVLRPALGDDPRLWAELHRHAPGFRGTLPELAAAIAAGTVPEPAAAAASAAETGADAAVAPAAETAPDATVELGPQTAPDAAGELASETASETAAAAETAPETAPEAASAPAPVPGLAQAVDALAPGSPLPVVEGVQRELALASLAVPNAMGDRDEDIRWVRACLDQGVLTGTDVVRHKAPAAWALDEDHWLGDVDYPDRHDRPAAVLAARAEADRLFAEALGEDPDAWWRTARALPDFVGTLPELLAAVIQGDSVSKGF